MKFRLEPGNKGNGDQILLSVCPYCGRTEKLVLADLIKWLRFKAYNEEKVYPPPKYKGAKKVLELIDYATRRAEGCEFIYSVEECCRLCQIEIKDHVDYKDIK